MKKLIGIAYKPQKKAPLIELDCADISIEEGLVIDIRGASRQGRNQRQISIMSLKSWQQACAELPPQLNFNDTGSAKSNVELPWTARRANLLVDDINFSASDIGRILRVGDVRLQITQETDPCSRMDAVSMGLMQALTPAWRGGACAKVLNNGSISIGDSIEFIN